MMQPLPGLIDIHVHLREPGATHKEDFYTASRAAIKGGFTYLLDMPNNPIPTFSLEALEEKVRLSQNALCDIGFHYGTNGLNLDTFPEAWEHSRVFGLKIYCNETTGKYIVSDEHVLDEIFSAWNSQKPILVHAEGTMLPKVLAFAKKYHRRLHACHVSTRQDIDMLRSEKACGTMVTCGVCPHHLFLTQKDKNRLGNFSYVKPPLGTNDDQDALWEGLHDGTIDIVESDHAPHTIEEKMGAEPVYGMPGLETTLGLLSKAVQEGKLPKDAIKKLLYETPKSIFAIPDQPDTYIEYDLDEPFIVGEHGYETKCQWSPFDGWTLYGAVHSVVFRGKIVYQEGRFVV
ncbi:MAG: amidohydrolase family protein [Patescibacteria group bacterium]|nr:amidohydrolase family protein [Patescibacteria group bacterium]